MRAAFTAGCLLLMITTAALAAADTARPNIVVILVDDMGYSDIGCYGSEIRTPNLDKLAATGLRFTQFYNTGRCCPTRASLLTGLYPHQAGVGHMVNPRPLPGYQGRLNDQCVTIAQVLRAAGYATAIAGKWHVTDQMPDLPNPDKSNWPLQRGFDKFYGTITGAGNFFNPWGLVIGNHPSSAPSDGQYYYTDAIGDNAVKFIEHKPADKPLFLYVAFTAPHWPLQALEQDIARYADRYTAGWDALRDERYARMIEMGIIDRNWPLTERPGSVKPWEKAEHKAWEARRMAVYAAMIDRMDQNVGRIVEALKARGELDNTLILFLADNGGCAEGMGSRKRNPSETRDGRPIRFGNDPSITPGGEDTYQSYDEPWANASNTPFRLYKHYVHEGGIATPLIAHWPARIRRAGELEKQPGHLVDIMATCVEIGGAKYPQQHGGNSIAPMQGVSLTPAFDGKPLDRKRPLFFEHEGNRAIREGDWKLVAKGAAGPWELYNLREDRSETRNLAKDHPERVSDLAAKWDAMAREFNALPWPWKK